MSREDDDGAPSAGRSALDAVLRRMQEVTDLVRVREARTLRKLAMGAVDGERIRSWLVLARAVARLLWSCAATLRLSRTGSGC
jgi:hypothetical protein